MKRDTNYDMNTETNNFISVKQTDNNKILRPKT